MIRTTLLAVIATLLWAGWAWAREQEILDHPNSVKMQEMEDQPCQPSSSPSGAG